MNCCISPFATTGFDGVIEREMRVAGASVIVVVAETEPEVAIRIELPESATAVASPPLVMVTALVVAELQVMFSVRS